MINCGFLFWMVLIVVLVIILDIMLCVLNVVLLICGVNIILLSDFKLLVIFGLNLYILSVVFLILLFFNVCISVCLCMIGLWEVLIKYVVDFIILNCFVLIKWCILGL